MNDYDKQQLEWLDTETRQIIDRHHDNNKLFHATVDLRVKQQAHATRVLASMERIEGMLNAPPIVPPTMRYHRANTLAHLAADALTQTRTLVAAVTYSSLVSALAALSERNAVVAAPYYDSPRLESIARQRAEIMGRANAGTEGL